jgi:hypothetical protein
MLAEPAVVLLGRILRDETQSAADRIRAAIAVLDRTGYPAGVKLELEDAREPLWMQMLQQMWEEQDQEEDTPALPQSTSDGSDVADTGWLSEAEADVEREPTEPPYGPPATERGRVIDGVAVDESRRVPGPRPKSPQPRGAWDDSGWVPHARGDRTDGEPPGEFGSGPHMRPGRRH